VEGRTVAEEAPSRKKARHSFKIGTTLIERKESILKKKKKQKKKKKKPGGKEGGGENTTRNLKQ